MFTGGFPSAVVDRDFSVPDQLCDAVDFPLEHERCALENFRDIAPLAQNRHDDNVITGCGQKDQVVLANRMDKQAGAAGQVISLRDGLLIQGAEVGCLV